MKRHLMSVLLAAAMFAVPAVGTAALAAAPPPPCIPGPHGECILVHNGSYRDPTGVTISATWDVDINSGNIVAVYPSTSLSQYCGPTYYPTDPNVGPYPGPVTVSYQALYSYNIIKLTLYNSGSYSGSDGTSGAYCL